MKVFIVDVLKDAVKVMSEETLHGKKEGDAYLRAVERRKEKE